jgi:TatD DNase family protein
MWIDTHCHLDATEFDADRDVVVASARLADVRTIVIPAVAAWNFDRVRHLAHHYGGCVYALGIHPMLAPQASDADLDTLRRAIEQSMPDPKFVGVGEIGLDYFIPGLDPQRQMEVYVAQLKLAREFDLPVLLHVRKSQDQVAAQARHLGVRRGIAHAFNGSVEQAGKFIELGMKLGIGGNMTYSRANRIRRIASELPIEALVLETDAPDIAPAWLTEDQFGEQKKVRNVPAEVSGIAHALAELRQIDVTSLAESMRVNSLEALPRLAGIVV